MLYRPALSVDAEPIAALHARSWQETYRGIMPDSFLDHEVVADRLAHWREQFRKSPSNQSILVAETDGQLAGFAGALAGNDPVYGTLLDNLHVSAAHKGQGVGRQLMKRVAEWVQQQSADSSFYLWVYEQNYPARRFYDNLGAVNHEAVPGEHAVLLRYVWPDVKTLIATVG